MKRRSFIKGLLATLGVVATGAEVQADVNPVIVDAIEPQDITVKMRQYSCLYRYSDKTTDLFSGPIAP